MVVTTPDVCSEDSGSTHLGAVIRLRAKATGTCSVTVTLTGTSISATQSFPITLSPVVDAGAREANVVDAGDAAATNDD